MKQYIKYQSDTYFSFYYILSTLKATLVQCRLLAYFKYTLKKRSHALSPHQPNTPEVLEKLFYCLHLGIFSNFTYSSSEIFPFLFFEFLEVLYVSKFYHTPLILNLSNLVSWEFAD